MRFEEAVEILRAFEREGVRYVLIGSLTMAAQGIVRATRNVGFFISSESENVDRVKRALHAVFADDSIDEISSDDLSGSYPVIRYGPPEGDFVIEPRGRYLMPVRKMRHISEVTAPVAPPLRAENLRSAFELSEACFRLRPADRIRGVRRYRSLEDAAESPKAP